jgi:hypothetical protein
MSTFLAGTRESSEIFTVSRPASTYEESFRDRRAPFEVIPIL